MSHPWARRRRGAFAFHVAAVAASVAARGAPAARADDGGAPAPRLPVASGAAIEVYAPRPPRADAPPPACSLTTPLCVRPERRGDERRTIEVLATLERHWRGLFGALQLPAPRAAFATGRFDVYLTASDEEPRAVVVARDPLAVEDRALAALVVGALAPTGCVSERALAEALAAAALLSVAPAADPASRVAASTYLSTLLVSCSDALGGELFPFQARPARSLFDAHAAELAYAPLAPLSAPERADHALSRRHARGSSLFWAWMERKHARAPGALVWTTWALAVTSTPRSASTWESEPDVLDVLEKGFEGRYFQGSSGRELAGDFAVARIFMGTRDDGLHLPETRTLGDAAALRFDWDIPWPSAPRRLAPRAPTYPLGASYVRVSTEGAPAGARLRFEIEWEEHAAMAWTVVRVDRAGRELGRIAVRARDRATEAALTVVDLTGTGSVVLVGVGTGDPFHRFDPDDAVWEPHGWLVTLAEER